MVAISRKAGHVYLPRGWRAGTILPRSWRGPLPNWSRLFAWCSTHFVPPLLHLSGKIELASLPDPRAANADSLDLDAVRRVSTRADPWQRYRRTRSSPRTTTACERLDLSVRSPLILLIHIPRRTTLVAVCGPSMRTSDAVAGGLYVSRRRKGGKAYSPVLVFQALNGSQHGGVWNLGLGAWSYR